MTEVTQFFSQLFREFELPLTNPVLIFSLVLLIILLAPILLKRLNIPGIIGLILSGVAIGPHGFNLLANNSAVELFSTIGLLYIMFIAGLELDLNEFKLNRNKSLVFGFFTFIIPLAIGFPVMYYLLGPYFGFDFNASFLTASMFATHTLVAYPIVSRFGISKNQAVAITVGGTILTDTGVLLILAVIIGNHQGTLDTAFWVQLGISLAIFSAIMFFLIPRISKWFFKKLESEKHAHYIYVLSVVFFGAFLAEVAGVEAIIGAFVAGLALNPLIPQSSALMNRIEFIGNSLFIPFFLISVGMLVDVSVVLSGWTTIIIGAALTITAIFGKWLAAWFTQLIYRYSSAQRQLIFGLSGGHAAATLAVIIVGHREGILDESILNGTIILILITCVVASFAAEKASKKIVLEEKSFLSPDEIKQESLKNELILIPVYNPNLVENLLDFSLIIRDKKSSNPITLLSVVPHSSDAESFIMQYKSEMEKFIPQGSAAEGEVTTMTTIDHNPASGIARVSKEMMADFVIIGWPQKTTSLIDRIFGEKIDSIIESVDRNLILCNFPKPLIESKRLILVVPPLTQREDGFKDIITKVFRISQEYTMPVTLYANDRSHEAMKRMMKMAKISGKFTYKKFTWWEDFLIISKDLKPSDLIIFIASRKGSLSFNFNLEKIPFKLEQYLPENNLMAIYPSVRRVTGTMEEYEDFSPATLKSLENWTKGIGSLFKRDRDDEEGGYSDAEITEEILEDDDIDEEDIDDNEEFKE